MAHELRIPALGESIREVQIGQWLKQEGEWADKDENLVEIESDKATVELPAPAAGVITKILKHEGEVVPVGEVVGYLEEAPQGAGHSPAAPPAPPKSSESPGAAPAVGAAVSAETQPPQATRPPGAAGRRPAHVMPAAAAALAHEQLRAEEVQATGPGGRLLKEDVLRHVQQQPRPAPVAATAPGDSTASPPAVRAKKTLATAVALPPDGALRLEEAVPMSLIRRRTAERLVEAQHTGALLTTFNEVDMSAVVALRQQYREAFQQKYNVKLGFMSFFVKAVIEGLKACPELNAEIRGNDIVYHNYYDIGIAVASGRGLVVPVLRNAERLSFAQVEQAIGDLAARAQANKLKPEELARGTFTITNGGVFGSMLSTPIVNPPQSGILGLHAVQDRPVARDGLVVIRPMMYMALGYDHRIVDGREAVSFLRRVKEVVEEPARMLIEV
jgi:2-oxoglutarate dehydrogenase E2 component (dihydrolipoamide succinyltransferase)